MSVRCAHSSSRCQKLKNPPLGAHDAPQTPSRLARGHHGTPTPRLHRRLDASRSRRLLPRYQKHKVGAYEGEEGTTKGEDPSIILSALTPMVAGIVSPVVTKIYVSSCLLFCIIQFG